MDELTDGLWLQERTGAGGFVWTEEERWVGLPGKQVGKVNIIHIHFTLLQQHTIATYVRHWVTELQKAEINPEYKPSLAKAIARSFGAFFLSLGLYTFMEECCIAVFQPLLMGKIST